MADVISRTDLENAKVDALALDAIVNGAATDPDVATRTGPTVSPVAKVMAAIGAVEETASASRDQAVAARDIALTTAEGFQYALGFDPASIIGASTTVGSLAHDGDNVGVPFAYSSPSSGGPCLVYGVHWNEAYANDVEIWFVDPVTKAILHVIPVTHYEVGTAAFATDPAAPLFFDREVQAVIRGYVASTQYQTIAQPGATCYANPYDTGHVGVVGDVLAVAATATGGAVTMTYKPVTGAVKPQLDATAKQLATLNAARPRPSTSIFYQDFTTFPSSGVSLGSWYYPNGATKADATKGGVVLSSPSSGWNNNIQFQKGSSMQYRRINSAFTPAAASNIVFFGSQGLENFGGLIAAVNGATNELRLYGWNGTTATLVGTPQALPGPLVVGRRYEVFIEKRRWDIVFTLLDTRTGLVTKTSCNGYADPWPRMHGFPMAGAYQGSPVIHYLGMEALHPADPIGVIISMSIGEGDVIGKDNFSWVQSLAATRWNWDLVVAGRSGDEMDNFPLRAEFDLTRWLSAKFWVLDLGENDWGNPANWFTKMNGYVTTARAAGIKVYVTSITPYASQQTAINTMNARLDNQDLGTDVTVIQMARAVTVGNDGVTWAPGLVNPDGQHPTVAGDVVMEATARATIKELR